MRGIKPQNKVEIRWSPSFAYAIGILATDGNLSPNGRTINLTSKDREQVLNLKKIFKLDNKIGRKGNGHSKEKKYFVLQFGDINFYRFLNQIGLTKNKSKTIGTLVVPDKYFFDFLRGVLDGDGYTHSYWDKRWKSSFMFYLGFASASKDFVDWLRSQIKRLTKLQVQGHVTKSSGSSCFQLKYAKQEALEILEKMYHNSSVICLSRKRLKIEKTLGIVGEKL